MFFKNFPLVEYSFGDGEPPILFDNITTYVDIIDQVKQEVSFYEKYTILDGDRPDVVSQKLYGRPDYHWTFLAMNDNLRESGWPMPESELRELVKQRYPHRVVTTQSNFASNFLPGTQVVGKTSGTTGIVIERNLDLGQLVIATEKNGEGVNKSFVPTEQIVAGVSIEEQAANIIVAKSEIVQYNSVRYYTNTAGDVVDINPYNQVTTGLIPVTQMDYNISFNDNLKSIVVIKPKHITRVVGEYINLLRK